MCPNSLSLCYFHLRLTFESIKELGSVILASTTWSSHSLGIPLWQPIYHLGLGPWSMKQFLSPFTRCVYFTFFSLYNIVLINFLGCINFFLFFVHMNPNGKVQLIFIDVLGNFPIPLMSKDPNDIPAWNKKVDEYIIGVFLFCLDFLGL